MKNAKNIFERMQLMMTSMSSYELEIEDKEGNIYMPSGASATGNGGGSSQSLSFNGKTQKRTSQSSEPELPTLAFRFKATPSKVSPLVLLKPMANPRRCRSPSKFNLSNEFAIALAAATQQ
jgi:hypothetical protein